MSNQTVSKRNPREEAMGSHRWGPVPQTSHEPLVPVPREKFPVRTPVSACDLLTTLGDDAMWMTPASGYWSVGGE
jgi:hypothetical protein